MDLFEIIKVSFLALRTNKLRSFLTTLGIIIGVSSVILLVSIGSGLQDFVTKQFQSLGSNVIFILPGKIKFGGGERPTGIVNKLQFNDVKALRRLGYPIITATVVLQKSVTIKFLNKTTDTLVNGVDENFQKVRSLQATNGRFINNFDVFASRKSVIVGPKVIVNLKTTRSLLKEQIIITDQRYNVVGLTESKGGGFGGPDLDDTIYIPYTSFKKQFSAENPSAILIKMANENETERAQNLINEYYKTKRKLTSDDFTVFDQKELLTTINQFLGVITIALGGIAAISLLVGGIGIMNIMLVSVTERTREIGLRKAIGAEPKDIMIQFLIEAIFLSFVGGLIGVLIGFLGSLAISSVIKTSVTTSSVLLAFGISSLVGGFFGVAPAVKASRLSPIEALRYE